MRTQCPHCQTEFKASDGIAGKKVNCPKCDQPFVISPLIKDNKVEVCSKCGKEIGRLQQACVFSDKIVCAECDKKLRGVIEEDLNKVTEAAKKRDYSPSHSAFGGPVGTIIFVLMMFIGIPLTSYPLNASGPYILSFPSTSCRYGTAVVATACCIRR